MQRLAEKVPLVFVLELRDFMGMPWMVLGRKLGMPSVVLGRKVGLYRIRLDCEGNLCRLLLGASIDLQGLGLAKVPGTENFRRVDGWSHSILWRASSAKAKN